MKRLLGTYLVIGSAIIAIACVAGVLFEEWKFPVRVLRLAMAVPVAMMIVGILFVVRNPKEK